jgi:hypothetical protein
VHDFCINNFKYDHAFGENAYTILGLVLDGKAVCEGIAKFVKLALSYLGVKSLVVHGNAIDPTINKSEMHAWNIVKLNGKTFHLDVTYDLGVTKEHPRHDYFNLTDDEISVDHEWIRNVPVCDTAGMDYYTRNGAFVNNSASLNKYIKNKLAQWDRHMAVKFYNEHDGERRLKQVEKAALKHWGKIHKGNLTIEISKNLKQSVFELSFM